MKPRDLKKGLNLLVNNALACKVYTQEVLCYLYEFFMKSFANSYEDKILCEILESAITASIKQTADKYGLYVNLIIKSDDTSSDDDLPS